MSEGHSMGAAESRIGDLRGTLDGTPVRWVYEQDEKEEAVLSWTGLTALSPNSDWNHLNAGRVVAVLPASDEEAISTVLYVVETKANDDKSASPVVLKSFEASGLPAQFTKTFTSNAVSQQASASDFHVLVSTGSGTGQAKAFLEEATEPALKKLFSSPGGHCTVHITDSSASISTLTTNTVLPRANAGRAQSMLLLSGDGGAVDLINGLLSAPRSSSYTRPTLYLFPLGTGNALAHSVALFRDSTFGLSSFFRGTRKEIPIFRTNFSPGAHLLINEARDQSELALIDGIPTVYGAVVCSWGLHAGLVADSDTAGYRKLGSERFQLAAKENLFPADGSEAHHYKGRVSFRRVGEREWRTVERDAHAYVLATTCSHLEKGFNISPASKPLDGKLRLVHFGALGGKEVMEIMTAAYQGGKHVADGRVGYEEIDGLRIEFQEEEARWRRVCVDGKIIAVEQNGWVEVGMGVQGVLDLVVPC